jgi:hypothetical protein
MKKLNIYEPAMCCSTGICGVGIDQELLRISTVLSSLEKNGTTVHRFNLSSSPQEFVDNQEINNLIMEKGIEVLPGTVVDNKIVKTGSYPTNEELINFLNIAPSLLEKTEAKKEHLSETSSTCCEDGDCC